MKLQHGAIYSAHNMTVRLMKAFGLFSEVKNVNGEKITVLTRNLGSASVSNRMNFLYQCKLNNLQDELEQATVGN